MRKDAVAVAILTLSAMSGPVYYPPGRSPGRAEKPRKGGKKRGRGKPK